MHIGVSDRALLTPADGATQYNLAGGCHDMQMLLTSSNTESTGLERLIGSEMLIKCN